MAQQRRPCSVAPTQNAARDRGVLQGPARCGRLHPSSLRTLFNVTMKRSTVDALRRDTSTAQAIRARELTRTVTLLAVVVTASPPAIALGTTTLPVVGEGGAVAGPAVFKSKTARETLYYVCVGMGACNGGRPSLARIQHQERNAQVKDDIAREAKAKVREFPDP